MRFNFDDYILCELRYHPSSRRTMMNVHIWINRIQDFPHFGEEVQDVCEYKKSPEINPYFVFPILKKFGI